MFGRLINHREFGFADAADRTYPIARNVIKRCAWIDSVVRVAVGGIIDVTTYVTNVPCHGVTSRISNTVILYAMFYFTIAKIANHLENCKQNLWVMIFYKY